MPLLGYAVGSDPAQRTITLNHHSKMKNLCDTFKVDDATAFDKYDCVAFYDIIGKGSLSTQTRIGWKLVKGHVHKVM